jgi:hypothetical protein
VYVCIHSCVHVYPCVRACVRMYVCIHVYVRVYKCVYVCVYSCDPVIIHINCPSTDKICEAAIA